MQQHEARLNITYGGNNGDLPDPISFDAGDGDIKTWAAEAIQTGSVPGIDPDPNVDLNDFVVDRFEANEHRDFNMVQLRPKTPFGQNTPFVP